MRPPHRFQPIHFTTWPCMHSSPSPLSPACAQVHAPCPSGSCTGSDARENACGRVDPRSGCAVVLTRKLPAHRGRLLEKLAQCFLTSDATVAECECPCGRPAARIERQDRSRRRVNRAHASAAARRRGSREPIHGSRFPSPASSRRTGRERRLPPSSGSVEVPCVSSFKARIEPSGRWEPAVRRCMALA